MREREVEAKRLIGKKIVKGKKYEYEYYTLPLNIYIPKSMIEKFGTKYKLTFNEAEGTIIIKPVK
jgi:hypothetical protein